MTKWYRGFFSRFTHHVIAAPNANAKNYWVLQLSPVGIGLAEQIPSSEAVMAEQNPNAPCPCGSDKAYKDCCGKGKM